jgi:hypothetical protein
MLAAQLFASVVAVALAGWTLAITNDVMSERDRLRERVVQLEGELGARGIVVPPATAVVNERGDGDDIYPAEIGFYRPAASDQGFDPRQIFTDLFAPPPALRTLVIHARSEQDGEAARRLAEGFAANADLQVTVNVVSARDPRQSGYVYYDGRQSRHAAELVARFTDDARRAEIPQWSAQLRGRALPTQGEFTVDRLDIILPPLPPAPAPIEPPIEP